MTASRLQHTVASGVVLLVAALVTYISFTQQPADAFLFPRLISIFFIILAVWNFARAVSGVAKVGTGLNATEFKNILPGLIVMIVFVFLVAKSIGFYLSSAIAFMIIYTLYDPAPYSDGKAWSKRLIVTVCFMAVMYCLFALLLKVQTPSGILF
jgi:small-conductance mechanosensitive channel